MRCAAFLLTCSDAFNCATFHEFSKNMSRKADDTSSIEPAKEGAKEKMEVGVEVKRPVKMDIIKKNQTTAKIAESVKVETRKVNEKTG